MAKNKTGYKPTELEVKNANNTLIADFLYSDQMQNLADTHGEKHIVEVRVVAYKEGQDDSPCLMQRLPGIVVARNS